MVLVTDLPDGIAFLNHGDMRTLGLDYAQARALAQSNMATALVSVPTETAAPGVLRARANDDYEASRLMLPQLWNEVARRVNGELLVIASNRHTVFATGSKDAAAVVALIAVLRA